MTIDAIILSNSSDLAHYGLTSRTINSLRVSDHCNDVDIIVVESQSILDFQTNGFLYPGCKIIHPKESFGYNKFLNIGIDQTDPDSEWILICNNDLFFTKDWLSEAKKIIEKYPDIRSFSPRCPNWHLHQNPSGDIVEGYTVSKEICGWCILLHRDIIDECGLFDEQFDFWYQDNDYAMTLESFNIKHALMNNSKVYHMVSGSHDLLNDRYQELTHNQQQKFLNKWKKNS